MKRNKILLLEDDLMIAGGLIYALEHEQYEVVHGRTVGEAREALNRDFFDLAILDMQLPDGLGTEISEILKGTKTMVIFLTVVDDEGNVVKAFEEGASDYITKPFRLRELLARIKRLLAQQYPREENLLTVGDVRIDVDTAKVYLNDVSIDLTALEYKLLLTFATNKGRIMTREQILDKLWDSTGNFVEDNTLTVYIKRLRKKIGEGVKIETVRGLGYRVE